MVLIEGTCQTSVRGVAESQMESETGAQVEAQSEGTGVEQAQVC
jgi:hypothetical protein